MFLCKMFLSNLMHSSVFFIFAVVVVGMVGTSLAVVLKFSTLLCSSHCVLNSSPFKNGNFLLKMELESEAFFLGIFH